jgi:hypothetical protein
MPIYAERNLYKGVNPHFNSWAQNKGLWRAFHGRHIFELVNELNELLPSNYLVIGEQSLQISISESPEDQASPRRSTTIADVGILRTSTEVAPLTAQQPMPTTPTLTLPIVETVDESAVLDSVMIYRVSDEEGLGRPVTRIELLSPANKPFGSHYTQYIQKRWETLSAGLRLVEIDYLHQTHPILSVIPSYVDREPNAQPYYILVTDPYPSLETGRSFLYSFSVQSPIPLVRIPLDVDDSVVVDFGKVYDRTLAENRAFLRLANYAQLPDRFDTYAPADQERIKARMNEIAAGQI